MNSGTTHDGLAVLPEYKVTLKFSAPCGLRDNFEVSGFGVWLEFNANADGKRYPYIVIQLGKRIIQFGWLWG